MIRLITANRLMLLTRWLLLEKSIWFSLFETYKFEANPFAGFPPWQE
jgi:hypothetical protein